MSKCFTIWRKRKTILILMKIFIDVLKVSLANKIGLLHHLVGAIHLVL